jgi:hypothetical protein
VNDDDGVTERGEGSASDEPTEEEMVAIVSAIEAVWPRPVVAGSAATPPRWRFAGRWWSKPVPARRERPW